MSARAKRKIKKPVFPALEWLTDASGRNVRVTMVGSNRAMVENHTGILEFSDHVIRLKTRKGALLFEGLELVLTEVRPDALTIRGSIERVVLPAKKEGEHA